VSRARHDPRDDYADAAAPAGGRLDWLFAARSVAPLALVLSVGLCLPAFPITALLAGLGVTFCRDPEARHHATLLLVVAAAQAVILAMFVLDGAGFRIQSF
jgi:hypothetical protein